MQNNSLKLSLDYYIICSVPRSGSTLLGKTLAHSEVFHSFTAPFNLIELRRWVGNRPFLQDDIFQYLNSLLPDDVSDKTAIGFVIEYPQFRNFLDLLHHELGDKTTDLEALNKVFPGAHFAFLRRHNRVRQAISLVRAMQSQLYTQIVNGGRQNTKALHYNTALINNALLDIIGAELDWQRFFLENNLTPYELFYEELASDLNSALVSLLQHWNISAKLETSLSEPETAVMSDDLTEEWLCRYLSESLLADSYLYSALLNGNFSPLLAKLNIPFERMAATYWSQRLPSPLWKLAFLCFHPRAFRYLGYKR
jgi:LPS sulfotransferase NodH